MDPVSSKRCAESGWVGFQAKYVDDQIPPNRKGMPNSYVRGAVDQTSKYDKPKSNKLVIEGELL